MARESLKMYLAYFDFDSYPFTVTPGPSLRYLGRSHREALGHLLDGAGEQGGFVALIGEGALMDARTYGRADVGPWSVLRAIMKTHSARPRPRRMRARWRRLTLRTATGAVALSCFAVGLAWLPDIPVANAAQWARDTQASGNQLAQAGDIKKNSDAQTTKDPSDKGGGSAEGDPKAAAGVAASTSRKKDSKPAAAGADNTSPDDAKTGAAATSDGQSKKSGQDKSKDKTNPKKDKLTLPKGDANINQVLRLWGVFGAQIHSGCSDLHVGDLRCLDDTGDFATVRRYNRPALLVLKENNHRQTVLLSGVNDDGTVTLVGGDGARDVDRKRLLKLWTGRFKVVWRSDAGVALIQPDSVGDAVVWLRKRLMQIDGKKPNHQKDMLSPVYGEALGKRLKAFQKSHDLKPDGIAGPRTQMMLNGAVPSPGAPSLKPVKSSEKK